MTQVYKYAITYFLLFSLLLVVSGAILFEHKIGFSVQGVLDYYQGSEENFTQAKPAVDILKTSLPHILAFGLFTMVLLHFLVFTKAKKSARTNFLIYLVFATGFIEIFSPLFIINGFEFFAYLKLFSFILFQGLIIYIAWLLFSSILRN